MYILFYFIKPKLGRMRPFLLKKGETDIFLLTQTLVLSIKLATVNSIPDFGVSTAIMLSHRYLSGVMQVEL